MNCGEFLLVHYPFTDQTGAKLRPVLVVSSDSHNHGSDLVVVPVSSRPSPSDRFSYHLDISPQKFQSAGLKRSSSIKWTKPLTIDKSVVVRKLGRLEPGALAEVRRKVASLFQ